jgi:hypothetical protein
MSKDMGNPEANGHLRLDLPVRPLVVLGLRLAPFSFFANPPGWIWALMLAPESVQLPLPFPGGGSPRQSR